MHGKTIALAVTAVGWLIASLIAFVLVARFTFAGIGLIGLMIWFICTRIELEKDAAVGSGWNPSLIASQYEARQKMSPEQRAAEREEQTVTMHSVRFFRHLGIALTLIGGAGLPITSSERRWVVPLALLVIGAHALWSIVDYADIFGGDPEIHIIFARNLLHGHPLQFNPGDFSSGETSPLYMLLVAAMDIVLGAYVPLGMKLAGAASLAGLCVAIGCVARRRGASMARAALLGAIPLMLPSMILQASLGMENMLFACLVVLMLQAWLEGRYRRTIAVLGLPLLFLLRPEAVLLGLCLAGLAALEHDGRLFAFLMLGAAVAAVELVALTLLTGVPLHAAALARVTFGRLAAHSWVDFKFVPFLLYCVPCAAVAWLHRKPIADMKREAVIFASLFCLPLLLHLLMLFPSAHFSRYFLYGYAVFFFLLARMTAKASAALGPHLLAAVVVLAVTVAPYEHVLRGVLRPSGVASTIAEMQPAAVQRNSDTFYEALGRPPVPVVLALLEVQLRGRLDDRFVVRSLDGIVDYRLQDYVRGDTVDYGGYFELRKVAFSLDPLPENSGVCLSGKELVRGAPIVPSVVYVVVSPRGC